MSSTSKITLTLPDGSERKVGKGTTGMEVAESIGPGLAKAALACTLDGEILDLSRPLETSGKFSILTFKDTKGKEVFWHSSAHLLAMAVLELWPHAQLTIGPPIEDGFYYDFFKKEPFTPEDLEKIEKKMEEWRDKRLSFVREDVDLKEARKRLQDNSFKLEILEDHKDSSLTFYSNTSLDPPTSAAPAFTDLCRGPHVPHTGYLKAFKLTKISSAYWRGDAKRESLQRIYGISFPDKKELKQHLEMIEEAKKRDHRRLGNELRLFTFHEISPGSPFFLPRGTIIFNELQGFVRSEYRKRGFQEVITPLIYDKSLWEQSGHWEHYREHMFLLTMDGKESSLKPMNCPSHCLIYKMHSHSYRDLPLRIADFAPLHRNEVKGALGGMTRVRKFSQDDAHIFTPLDKIEEELIKEIGFANFLFTDVFDFSFVCHLSTRPEKAMGTEEQWRKAEAALRTALEKSKIPFEINEGDGAFYGPKIDFQIRDALGRMWQLATVQLDFQMPERFELEYTASDGSRKRPVMIHRAMLGSLERFIGILTEHYAGRFPLWLAPEQVRILTVSDHFNAYAEKIRAELTSGGFRVSFDDRAESIPKKVREAQMEQIPVIITLGEKEASAKTVSPRTLDGKVKFGMKMDELLSWLKENRDSKKISISTGGTGSRDGATKEKA